ncbi:nitrile hydratase regulator [Sphaerisporangium krabiense]|uniref:ABC-type branched-subunit amino acid transport system substrate-binding protein n=1 Tax=Sphaerisporangium krabiense TaxID=763782 RepID=A0A7W8Z837_9ACTN|nr:substrate-binding domain-containing protein [Sphaerisporangium krabiense]MBB5628828.1 ABC-type branched-subunit amino acid transport system substrate-binding protein [Sphaerisporangium krabiense]GII60330.1 nitrile hydratase regulator [Sphaerisporangium krabiense]
MTNPVTVVIDPLEAHLLKAEAFRVGLVVPVSGVLGLLGPCAINCAMLAASEVNADGGVLGRPVELVLIDAGAPPAEVAREVAGLTSAGAVQGLVGTHTSDVRVAIERVVAGVVPFVYTPPHEGGTRRPGVYYLGEPASRQVGPGLDWLIDNRRARRWFLLGNDYVWPRLVHASARAHLRARSATVVGERFVPSGTIDTGPVIEELAAVRPDAVLVNLIGSDLVAFNRAFTASGLGCARLCGALEEHGLLAIGGDTTGELYAAMGYFGTLTTDANLGLAERYTRGFGPAAPLLNGHGHGCYEGVAMLAALARRAGSPSVRAIEAAADGTTITGGRGRVTLAGGQVNQRVYVGRADGLDFDVVTSV